MCLLGALKGGCQHTLSWCRGWGIVILLFFGHNKQIISPCPFCSKSLSLFIFFGVRKPAGRREDRMLGWGRGRGASHALLQPWEAPQERSPHPLPCPVTLWQLQSGWTVFMICLCILFSFCLQGDLCLSDPQGWHHCLVEATAAGR